tara:strand:- start:492 stop:704 length:213 start_codon:yes stop_codon:yes gene_type:complete
VDDATSKFDRWIYRSSISGSCDELQHLVNQGVKERRRDCENEISGPPVGEQEAFNALSVLQYHEKAEEVA